MSFGWVSYIAQPHYRYSPQIQSPDAIYVYTGGNRTMVAAATIVSMAAADDERISIFPLVCPNKAHCVSFSALEI